VRTRCLASGAVAAVVAGLGAAVAVPLATGAGSADTQRGTDAADHRAEAYDAQRMPQVMDDHVRGVLERSVPDLGPATFSAWGADRKLPPERYDEALEMSVKYGAREHSWAVVITHGPTASEGSLEEDCRQTLGSTDYLACDVTTTPDGRTAQVRLWALIPLDDNDGGGWRTATEQEISSGRPIWYDRNVMVVASKDTAVRASEMVRATSRAAAEQALLVPVDDLVEIGTDPALWIPGPDQPH
jgi:hypothetical protein